MYCSVSGIHTHESGVVNGEALFSVELLGLDRLLAAPFHIPNVRGEWSMNKREWGDFTEGSPVGNL